MNLCCYFAIFVTGPWTFWRGLCRGLPTSAAFCIEGHLKQPLVDFEQEAKALKQLRGKEEIVQLHGVVESNEEVF